MNTQTTTQGHTEDCLCVPCMMADLDATIIANGGEEALARITGSMIEVGETDRSERTRFAKPGQKCGRGVVRKISPRQVAFLRKLLDTRVISADIKARPWFTTDIENISLAGARTMIDTLLGCPERTDTPIAIRKATTKQAEWLGKLAGKDVPADIETIRLQGKDATFKDASKALDALFRAGNKVTKTQVEPLALGLYLKGEELYKVHLTRSSGQMVASLWTLFETPEPTARGLKFGEFVYQGKRPLNSLTADMRLTLDEAKAMGAQFHYCCSCGIELTNPESIAEGIGPICARKF